MGPFARHALDLIRNGYSPVPLKSDRNPLSLHHVRPGKQWNSLRTEPLSRAEIDTVSSYRWPVGIGVAGGFNGVVPFDIDCSDDIAREVFAAIAKVLPKPVVWRKGSKGGMTFFRTEDARLAGQRRQVLAAQRQAVGGVLDRPASPPSRRQCTRRSRGRTTG